MSNGSVSVQSKYTRDKDNTVFDSYFKIPMLVQPCHFVRTADSTLAITGSNVSKRLAGVYTIANRAVRTQQLVKK